MSHTPPHSLLSINSGSSSLKFTLFAITGNNALQPVYRGQVSSIGGSGLFQVDDADGEVTHKQNADIADHRQALQMLLDWLSKKTDLSQLLGAGHRVVHGGNRFTMPTHTTTEVLEYLQTLVPLAPNHQSANLLGINILQELQPDLAQVACFDTAFHHGRAKVEQCFALPSHPKLKDVHRYGFHGLSYQYIARVLPDYLGAAADGKIIVAHLGHGASLCAIHKRRSVATTMTFTPLDGVPMGTRCGAIDPGVVLYLLQQGMSEKEISDLLYFQSGLLGVSGISGDMAELLESSSQQAQFAIELFVHHVVRAIGSLAATLGGVDAIIFTAGIGEHATSIREAICQRCAWLGVQLDENANRAGQPCITEKNSPVQVWIIPTDEQRMIAEQTYALLTDNNPHRMSS